jgi:hypothetical protein
MKLQHLILAINLFISAERLFGQSNQTEKLFIPFLDKKSQINVIVTVSDFTTGQPCPLAYTNVLSNTNLFTDKEQKIIGEAFLKYKNVTTNSGPPGTALVDLYKTNFVIKAVGRSFQVENWVANFQYTNFEAYETIFFGAGRSGVFAKFRTKFNDGYNASISRVGDGSTLRFTEVRQNLINGVLAEFVDIHAQGTTWDYTLADFSHSRLDEYRQCTNGMVFGKYLMWNPINNNLGLEAEFKKPFDFEKHMINPFGP